jgi:hypothetical protein
MENTALKTIDNLGAADNLNICVAKNVTFIKKFLKL